MQAQDGLDAMAADLRAAVERRHAQLTQQLQHQTEVSQPRCIGAHFTATRTACCWVSAIGAAKTAAALFPLATLAQRSACPLQCFLSFVQAAASVLGALLSAADRTAAQGAQLRAAIAAADASDDYDTLAGAPRIAELCSAVRDQLRELVRQMATTAGPGGDGGGCVTMLRLKDNAKAATFSTLAQLGGFTQLRTKIAIGHSELSLRQLESLVMPSALDATLLQFFGGIPVGHSSATIACEFWAALRCADRDVALTAPLLILLTVTVICLLKRGCSLFRCRPG